MTPRPPTVAEARTFDRLARDPAFLRVWAHAQQDRPWYYGIAEPGAVRAVRIRVQWRPLAEPEPPRVPLTWRQEAAALCVLALATLALAAGLVGGALWALGRLREAAAP